MLAIMPRFQKRMARRHMNEFRREAGVPDAGWEQRFAARFALAFAAADLASMLGILPWRKQQTLDAIVGCYRAARGAVPDAGALLEQALGRVREVLSAGEGLVDLRPTNGERPTVEELRRARAFIKHDPDGATFYAIKREEFERLAAPLSAERVLQRLQRDGYLVTTKRRSLWKQVAVKGFDAPKQPYACVRETFLTAGTS